MLTNFACKAPTRIRRTLVLSNYIFRLIASQFSIVKVKHGALGQSPSFDSTACRKYFVPWGHTFIDNKRAARLWRLNNCCLSDDAEIEIEYQTRGGDIRAEALSMNVVRETAVDMYKRRTRLSNPISMLTREPHLSWHT